MELRFVGNGQDTRLTGPSHPIHTYARYVRFLRFSFLILIGCFVTLEGMKIKSVTPMHHAMSMDSPAVAAGGGLAVGGCRDAEQGL